MFFILRLISVSLITFRFLSDPKTTIEHGKGSFEVKYWYCFIALLFFPLCCGATWYYFYRKRQIQTAENQGRQRHRQIQDMEIADAQFVTVIPSGMEGGDVAQIHQIVADDHITIVSSAYVYQTATILTDEEIALHSTLPLCSAQIVQ